VWEDHLSTKPCPRRQRALSDRAFAATIAAMITPFSRALLSAVLCCACAACSALKKEEIPKAAPIRFPKANADGTKGQPQQVGAILLVNAEAGFVLINSHGRAMPEAGVALKCMRDGIETGIIAVGKERQGTNVVADVVTGSPRKGDLVFQ
jgi:hypothetical protein